MKKMLCVFLAVTLMFYSYNIVYADDIIEEEFNQKDLQDIIETSSKTSDELTLNSRIQIKLYGEKMKTKELQWRLLQK